MLSFFGYLNFISYIFLSGNYCQPIFIYLQSRDNDYPQDQEDNNLTVYFLSYQL